MVCICLTIGYGRSSSNIDVIIYVSFSCNKSFLSSKMDKDEFISLKSGKYIKSSHPNNPNNTNVFFEVNNYFYSSYSNVIVRMMNTFCYLACLHHICMSNFPLLSTIICTIWKFDSISLTTSVLSIRNVINELVG